MGQLVWRSTSLGSCGRGRSVRETDGHVHAASSWPALAAASASTTATIHSCTATTCLPASERIRRTTYEPASARWPVHPTPAILPDSACLSFASAWALACGHLASAAAAPYNRSARWSLDRGSPSESEGDSSAAGGHEEWGIASWTFGRFVSVRRSTRFIVRWHPRHRPAPTSCTSSFHRRTTLAECRHRKSGQS